MGPQEPSGRAWTRRAILSFLGLSQFQAAAEKGRTFPATLLRYADPSTEFPVYRLTDPSYASHLPASYERAISQRQGFLLFRSDRTGSPQAFRMDLKAGGSEQLTQAEALDGFSLTLAPNERSFCCFEGGSLRQIQLQNLKEKELYRIPAGWKLGRGFSLSRDGFVAALVETREDRFRLRLVRLRGGAATTLVEGQGPYSDPQIQPRRQTILYRQGENAWSVVSPDGRQSRRLPRPSGTAGPAYWSPDGKTVFYLHYPEDRRRLYALREWTPETNSDQLVAETSQFVDFDANADASVFVGASGNRVSPHILLLLRAARREFTLCEHRASDPARVAPIFSPNSQRVYFQSDRDGRWAIYCIPVEKFVERTGT
jgi:oligogalacturonide lyase